MMNPGAIMSNMHMAGQIMGDGMSRQFIEAEAAAERRGGPARQAITGGSRAGGASQQAATSMMNNDGE